MRTSKAAAITPLARPKLMKRAIYGEPPISEQCLDSMNSPVTSSGDTVPLWLWEELAECFPEISSPGMVAMISANREKLGLSAWDYITRVIREDKLRVELMQVMDSIDSISHVIRFPLDPVERFPWDMWEELQQRCRWVKSPSMSRAIRIESERLGLGLRAYIKLLWRKRSMRAEDLRWDLIITDGLVRGYRPLWSGYKLQGGLQSQNQLY